MACATRSAASFVVAFMTTMPPKPTIESFSPVRPSERRSSCCPARERSIAASDAGKHPRIAAADVCFRNSRRSMMGNSLAQPAVRGSMLLRRFRRERVLDVARALVARRAGNLRRIVLADRLELRVRVHHRAEHGAGRLLSLLAVGCEVKG